MSKEVNQFKAQPEWGDCIEEILKDKEFNEYWEAMEETGDMRELSMKSIAAAFYLYGYLSSIDNDGVEHE